MRDKIRALYYPDFWAETPTLKKSILLFDEIHFMDRPAFMFGDGRQGSFGMVGASSPMRQFEKSFRDEGVPIYVHDAPGGPLSGELLKATEADLADLLFMTRFQDGLRVSRHFRDLHIAPGNYGNGETNETVFQKVAAIDLQNSPPPLEVFKNANIPPFEYTTPEGRLKVLTHEAAFCSVKTNFVLSVASRQGFSPLADARPYSTLLSAKYQRALASPSNAGHEIPLTDLSLAIFDELVPTNILEKMTMTDTVRYRKESGDAREAFLEHLGSLQAKLGQVSSGADYAASINKVIATEIRPAAREFRNKLETISERLFGKIQAAALGWLGSSAAVQFFGDITWQKLLPLAGAAGAYVATEAIGARNEERAARRDCAISYLLDLE